MTSIQPSSRPVLSAVSNWLLQPASARPLAVLRIGLAAVLLVQSAAIAGSVFDLYGPNGLVQWPVRELIYSGSQSPAVPRIEWLVELFGHFNIDATAAVSTVFLCYVCGLVGLLLGWHTRVMALVAWLTHLAMFSTGYALAYGVDAFANIGLFYTVFMPVGAAWSCDRLSRPTTTCCPTSVRLSLLALRIHLCIVYFVSGFEKAKGIQWWNGEAIWRSLMLPEFQQFEFSWLAHVPWLAMVACWGTLAIELGYAVLVWIPWTRRAIVFATIGLHASIAVFLGLHSFAAVMIVLNLAAFGVDIVPPNASAITKSVNGKSHPLIPRIRWLPR